MFNFFSKRATSAPAVAPGPDIQPYLWRLYAESRQALFLILLGETLPPQVPFPVDPDRTTEIVQRIEDLIANDKHLEGCRGKIRDQFPGQLALMFNLADEHDALFPNNKLRASILNHVRLHQQFVTARPTGTVDPWGFDAADLAAMDDLKQSSRLQQQLAYLVNYTPSKWLLEQEIPVVLDSRAHRIKPAPPTPPAAAPPTPSTAAAAGSGSTAAASTTDPNRHNDSYAWSRDTGRLSGLCLSGGGIRSATFNLGILQGLASRDLLRRFDYCSSVSGGGYIHQWMAAWVKRQEEAEAKRSGRLSGSSDSGSSGPGLSPSESPGLDAVCRQLIPQPDKGCGPIPAEPIRWLRRYSNYLTPETGLFSADTWVTFAIWARNTFLNQIILISALLLILLVPHLLLVSGHTLNSIAGTANAGSEASNNVPVRFAVSLTVLEAIGFLLMVLSLVRGLRDARKGRTCDSRLNDTTLFGFVVVPSLVISVVVSEVGFYLTPFHLGAIRQATLLCLVTFIALLLLTVGVTWASGAMYKPGASNDTLSTKLVAGFLVTALLASAAGAGAILLARNLFFTGNPIHFDARTTGTTAPAAATPAPAPKPTMETPAPPATPPAKAPSAAGRHAKASSPPVKSAVYPASASAAVVKPAAPPANAPVPAAKPAAPSGWPCAPASETPAQGGSPASIAASLQSQEANPLCRTLDKLAAYFERVSLKASSGEKPTRWRLVVVFGPLVVTLIPFLAIVLQCGLVGYCMDDWALEWLARVRAWVILSSIAWTALAAISLFGHELVNLLVGLDWHWIKWTAVGSWLLTTAGGVLAGKSSSSSGEPGANSDSRIMSILIAAGPPAYIVGLLILLSWVAQEAMYACGVTQEAGARAIITGVGVVFAVPAAIFVLFGWRVDINEFSMHSYYRNRLARCYLGASNPDRHPDPLTGFDNQDVNGLRVNAFQPSHGYTGPLPVFCAALNISVGEDLAYQERKAASFAFGPVLSGYHVPWTARGYSGNLSYNGFVPTGRFAYRDGGVHISTAAAVSGAAVSPNMGYHTSPPMAFLLTMFNVRLGWWLPNPRRSKLAFDPKAPDSGSSYPHPRFAPLQLLRELVGQIGDDQQFVYLTDGGHFDNMGLYELVRRRCYEIVICDAEEDTGPVFEGIGMAIRKCRIDFGAEIELDLNQLAIDAATRASKVHWIQGWIKYPETGDAAPGRILYIKSSIIGKEAADVYNYHLQHKAFPQDSTADQWFTESQFESYRRLGQQVVDECPFWYEGNGNAEPRTILADSSPLGEAISSI